MDKTIGRRHTTDTSVLSSPTKLFSGLTAQQKKLVIQSAERRKFRANSVIVRSGDPAASLYLLTKGRVRYYRVTKDGQQVLLWWVAVGDVFGIGSLLEAPTSYIGTAETIDDCELLVWSCKRIRSLATATHELLKENALRIALHVLAVYADRLVGLNTETAQQRLARTLIQLGNRSGQARSNGVEFAITNEDLGSLANVSAFTASRHLKKWERQGAIQKRRGKILILSPESLLPD